MNVSGAEVGAGNGVEKLSMRITPQTFDEMFMERSH
jgi:hypothetical protein